jgi:hypothetical protein
MDKKRTWQTVTEADAVAALKTMRKFTSRDPDVT